MKHKPVIGIAGKKRSGKDTVADLIVAQGYYRYGFADPIKSITEIGLGISTSEANKDEHKERVWEGLNGRSPRTVWQKIGTEWGRDTIHPDIWLIIASWHMEKHGHNMVLADVRFENEANWIRRQGGRIIHLRRPRLEPTTDTHSSEAGITVQYGDITLANDSTMVTLKERVMGALNIIGGSI